MESQAAAVEQPSDAESVSGNSNVDSVSSYSYTEVVSSDSDPDVEITAVSSRMSAGDGVPRQTGDRSPSVSTDTAVISELSTSAVDLGHSSSVHPATSAHDIVDCVHTSMDSAAGSLSASAAGTSSSAFPGLDYIELSQTALTRLSGIDRLVASTTTTSDSTQATDTVTNADSMDTLTTDPLPGPSSSDTSATEVQSPKKYAPSAVTSDKLQTPGKSQEKDEEEGQCCPICFDQWTNSGQHRLVSLKCGHLFGQSCIEKWLGGQSGGKCPQCNKKAKKRDIRVLYAKSLKVIDTSEKDEALKQLEKERKSRQEAELHAAQTRLLLQMARDECRRLTDEINRQKQQLEHYTAVSSSSAIAAGCSRSSQVTGSQFELYKSLKISEAPDCRVMSYCPGMATLCVSQASCNALFPGFGVKKVSVLDFKTSQYVAVHSKVIRDMCVSEQEDVLLSASIDKTVKVTSLSSNTVIQTYSLPAPVWSCAWDKDNPVCFYAGMQNGVVHVYDTRNTASHVEVLSTEGSRSPVVGMQYLRYNPRSSVSTAGLIVGQLDRTSLYEKQQNEYRLHLLPLEGNLTSLSVDDGSRHLLATYRPTQRHPSVRHVLYELSPDLLSPISATPRRLYTCNSIHAFHGGSTMKILARSRLAPHPTGKGGLIVAGDEATRCLHVWEASNGEMRQKIPINAAVIDVRSITYNNTYHLVALTDRQIYVYKWTS